MSDITLHELANPITNVALPCGLTVGVHKLKARDWEPALMQLQHFMEAQTVALDRDLTDEDLRAGMPAVLMETFLTPIVMADADGQPVEVRIGREPVANFIAAFANVTLAQLEAFDYGDWETLWAAIWETAKYPFTMRRAKMASMLQFANARAAWWEIQRMQAEERRRREEAAKAEMPAATGLPADPSSATSAAPASIPATATSPSNTSSPLPPSTPSTKRASSPRKGTRSRKATSPPKV